MDILNGFIYGIVLAIVHYILHAYFALPFFTVGVILVFVFVVLHELSEKYRIQ